MIQYIYEAEEIEQYPQLPLNKKAYEGIKALIHSRLNVKWVGLSKYKRDEMYGHVEDAVIKELDKKIRLANMWDKAGSASTAAGTNTMNTLINVAKGFGLDLLIKKYGSPEGAYSTGG